MPSDRCDAERIRAPDPEVEGVIEAGDRSGAAEACVDARRHRRHAAAGHDEAAVRRDSRLEGQLLRPAGCESGVLDAGKIGDGDRDIGPLPEDGRGVFAEGARRDRPEAARGGDLRREDRHVVDRHPAFLDIRGCVHLQRLRKHGEMLEDGLRRPVARPGAVGDIGDDQHRSEQGLRGAPFATHRQGDLVAPALPIRGEPEHHEQRNHEEERQPAGAEEFHRRASPETCLPGRLQQDRTRRRAGCARLHARRHDVPPPRSTVPLRCRYRAPEFRRHVGGPLTELCRRRGLFEGWANGDAPCG